MILRALLSAALIVGGVPTQARAASTINPNIPAQSSPLTSAPIRGNFANAANDINQLTSMFSGSSAPVSPTTGQMWNDTTSSTYVVKQWDGSTWVVWGRVNSSTHTFTPTMSAASILGTSPVTVGVSAGVATIGMNFNLLPALVSSGFMSTTSCSSPPATGQALSFCGGATPTIEAFNWGASTYLPLTLEASTFAFKPNNGATALGISATAITMNQPIVLPTGGGTPGQVLTSAGGTDPLIWTNPTASSDVTLFYMIGQSNTLGSAQVDEKIGNSIALVSGGSGTYGVGAILTVVGGTPNTATTATVTTVSGGVVTGVALANAGNYLVSSTPSPGAATICTGTCGTGATVTVGYVVNYTTGPPVPAGRALKYEGGILIDANDPQPGGGGSIMPAHAVSWLQSHPASGRVAYVNVAVGGTPNNPEMGIDNWDDPASGGKTGRVPTISAGGSNYLVGDQLILTGGGGTFSTAMRVAVCHVSGGVIGGACSSGSTDGLDLLYGGKYSVAPTSAMSVATCVRITAGTAAACPGGVTGATVTATFPSIVYLYTAAKVQIDAAEAALVAAGLTVHRGGVLLIDGETDANYIDTYYSAVYPFVDYFTVAQYKAAFLRTLAKVRSDYGATLPFYVSGIALTNNPSLGSTGVWETVRLVSSGQPYTFLAYGGADTFYSRDLIQNHGNSQHYVQAGYNEVGRGLAAATSSGYDYFSGFVPKGTNLYWKYPGIYYPELNYTDFEIRSRDPIGAGIQFVVDAGTISGRQVMQIINTGSGAGVCGGIGNLAINSLGVGYVACFNGATLATALTSLTLSVPLPGASGGTGHGVWALGTLPVGDGSNLAALPMLTGQVMVGVTGSTPTVTGPGTEGQLFLGHTGSEPTFVTMIGDGALAGDGTLTVSKINGVTFVAGTPTAGNLLIGSGTQWVSNAVTGDVTVNLSGVTAIGATKVTNAMLAGSIVGTKLVGTDITSLANLVTVGTLTSGATGTGFTVALSLSTITGTLAAARLPAFGSGDVSFAAGGGAGTIGAGRVTNAMLFGSIDISTKMTGTMVAAQFPALTGDATTSAGNLATTVAKINGVGLGTTTATAANVLIGDGTLWQTRALSGDVTVGSTGVTAIGVGKVTNTMLAGSIAGSKLIGTDITSLANLVTVGTLTGGGTGTGFSLDLTNSTVIGTLAAARLPAFGSGDVSFASGGGAGTIGAGRVTNTMIASMTSAQFAAILSNETGSGLAVFSNFPTFGDGTASQYFIVNGGGSGSNNGPMMILQAAGSNTAFIGFASAILGGAYDATLTLHQVSALYRLNGLNTCATGIKTDGSGNLSCITSSARFKTSPVALDKQEALDTVTRLRATTWSYLKTPDIEEIGLIAEEANVVEPRLVSLDNSGLPFTVKTQNVVGVLVGAVQALRADNDNLRDRLDRLEQRAGGSR